MVSPHCSLAEDEERLAFSVVWKMSPEGKILDEWAGRTVIRSCVKLAYGDAQAVIEDQNVDWEAEKMPKIHNGQTIEGVKTDVSKWEHGVSAQC